MKALRTAAAILALAMPFSGMAGPAAAAEKIIAIGGDVTEIVHALGHGERLIAVDSTSVYPPAVRELPNVGYMRNLSAEPILAMAPDHILAIADAGPASAVDVLKAAGVRYTTIPDEPSVAGTLAKVRAVGDAIGETERANAMAEAIEREVASLRDRVAGYRERPRTLFLLSVGRGGLMAGGAGTSADAMIKLAGGQNIAADVQGYKSFEPEAMNRLDPEVVVVTERTLQAQGGADAMLAAPQFAGTTAAKQGRLVAMDGGLLLGFGPRLPEALTRLAEALHPAETGQ